MSQVAATDSVPRRVGDQLRLVRTLLGIRQVQLAARLGVTQPYIAAVEAGRQNLTLAQMESLASALGVRVAVVFTTAGERVPADSRAEESTLLRQLSAVSDCAQAGSGSDEPSRALGEVRLGLLERLALMRPNVPAYAEAVSRARKQLEIASDHPVTSVAGTTIG